MKMVITKRELKEGGALINRINAAIGCELETGLSMYQMSEAINQGLKLNHIGTSFVSRGKLIIIIDEDFVCESTQIYADTIVSLVCLAKTLIHSYKSIINDMVEKFKKLIDRKAGRTERKPRF